MATYRNIQMSFWTDTKILNDFSPGEKLMYLYLMTNSHTNLCGCYEISVKQIAFDTGFSQEETTDLLEKLRSKKVIDFSKATSEVLIVNWHKYNWTSSEKLRKALEYSISNISYSPFKAYLIDLFNGIDAVWSEDAYPIDTVSIPYGYNGNVSFRFVSDSFGNVSVTDKDNVSDINDTEGETEKGSQEPGWKGQWTYKDPETGRIRFDVDKARKDRGV